MKFGYTIFYVDDVPKTIAFYENAFGLKRRFVHESNTYGELETGTTCLAFASKDLARANGLQLHTSGGAGSGVHHPFEIAFVTETVEQDFKTAVAHGATELKKPTQKPWGQLVGYVLDCNGCTVELCSPIG